MSLADDLKPLLYDIRSLPGRWGFRPYTVSVTVKSLSGSYGLAGTESTSTYSIVEDGGYSPKVRFLNDEELALGALGKGTIEVGPITPNFSAGGNSLSDITGGSATDTEIVHFTVTGPEFPTGALYRLIGKHTDKALHYRLRLAPVSDS